jgi:hypothetical protein
MAFHEIVYVSLACEDMTPAQLDKLLANCRAWNEKSGVTGVLVYHQREFLQMLEGEADEVLGLYRRIEDDQRHQQIYKLWDGPIAERSFANWSMAFVDQALIEAMPQAAHPLRIGQGLANTAKDSTGKKFLLNVRDELLRRESERA